ncbi:MAG: methyltransferase domain-containing protein [Anaerolineales bacterium]|nr:methyltransferase domain-containing protein [Anaerolineales bacterium]
MELADFHALLTHSGQDCLAAASALAPREAGFLAHLTRLQKTWPAPLAKAALETAILRRRALAKFERAAVMYFTREALEQASSERVSRYRAARFAGLTVVADLGCGIGGDSLGLAEQCQVTGVDHDPLRLAMAAENLAAYGRRARAAWLPADLNTLTLLPAPAFFFDPSRRSGSRRRFSVHDYSPPLDQIRHWLAQAPAGGVKISPGVDLAELAEYDCEVEFISERGELKECALWFGPLRSARRRATRLARGAAHSLLPDPAAEAAPPPPGAPLAYLYEPDPAVLRAGLVTTLAAQLEARQLDADIAYLTARALRATPWARAFVLEAALPFQLKRLRERLRALNVGRVTVKKRGSPLEPEALIKQLKLSGPEHRVVFLTHVLGQPWALIGAAIESEVETGSNPPPDPA